MEKLLCGKVMITKQFDDIPRNRNDFRSLVLDRPSPFYFSVSIFGLFIFGLVSFPVTSYFST